MTASEGRRLDQDSGDEEFDEELKEFQVEAPAEVRAGVYSDVALVSHDPDSFTIDFFATDPAVPGQGMLQARVKMSHRMALRLELALAENLRRWAPKELAARERESAEIKELLERAEGDEEVGS